MLSLVVAGLRTHSRRMVSAGLAIVLGVGFVTATLVLSSTVNHAIERTITADLARHTAVVEGPDHAPVSPQAVQQARTAPGVRQATPYATAYVRLGNPSRFATGALAGTDGTGRITQGRLPTRPGEIAVAQETATAHELRIGDRTTVAGEGGPADDERTRASTSHPRVVGVLDMSGAAATTSFVGVDADVTAWRGRAGYDRVVLDGPLSVTGAVQDRLGSSYEVRTAAEQAKIDVDEALGEANILTSVLLGFAAVALFVAVIVIGNTFSILLAQRTREMALLRCVGATRRQVRRTVVAEALGLGVLASAVGVLLGLGLSRLATAAIGGTGLRVELDGIDIAPVAVLAPLAVGVLVTLVAALRPAVRATRVTPLAALRPDLPTATAVRPARLRLLVASAAVLAGAAAMLAGVTAANAVLAIGGGMLSFVGVLVLTPLLVPALARVIGYPLRRLAGVPAEVAVDNLTRNTRRTAATTTALLVGVALISSIAVATATGRATAEAELDQRSPVDVVVTSTGGALPAGVLPAASGVDGVTASTPVRSATVGLAGKPHEVMGIDPAAGRAVVRSDRTLAALRPGAVVVPRSDLRELGLREGGTVQVAGRPFTVAVDQRDGPLLMTAADLARVAPAARPSAVWLRLADDTDIAGAMGEVGRVTRAFPDISVDGGATERTALREQTDLLLVVVTALLAVAVLIALIGVANTLGLSVLERTRESGLLRALGLTRRQLRASVGWEAVIIAAAGAVLGIALGTVYGIVGATALLRQFTDTVLIQVPGGLLALVAGAALLAGVGASVLPARRAARVSPAVALTAE